MIKRFSDWTKEYKEQFLNAHKIQVDAGVLREPSGEFDINGLRFPVEYLNELGLTIVMLPLEMMADYCDIITKENIDNNNAEFIFHQVLDSDFELEKCTQLNATSIGNLAYITLHCHDEQARKICEDRLNEIHVREKGKLLHQLNEKL